MPLPALTKRLVLAILFAAPLAADEPIDRQALVQRHNPSFLQADPLNALTLGNGSFAFTVDATGLQSFPAPYAADGLPLTIQSDWGWHSFPNAQGHALEDTYEGFDTQGREVMYPYRQHTDAGQWLRGNPHRIGLGQLGLEILKTNGETARIEDVETVAQTLDLWSGELVSDFTVEGQSVRVITLCHPQQDTLAARIESPLLAEGRLRLSLRFPYATSAWGINPNVWDAPGAHQTTVSTERAQIRFLRQLDETRFAAALQTNRKATFEQTKPHHFLIQPENPNETDFSVALRFSPDPDAELSLPRFKSTQLASQNEWRAFWESGGAIDLSQSSDPRAHELERRIVLSQYLTAIQCRGPLPPQETGLTFNSWYGKPHLEMTWWHAAHFPLWGRPAPLQRLMPWYRKILPEAQAIARVQGYQGARWPKNVGPDGRQVPSTISPLLLWQQPHPIYFAELLYRRNPTQETLEDYREIVFETAAFMASFPHFNQETQRFDLGPPMIPAQESYDPRTTQNPPFELAYWRWALETAQVWRERLGLPREPDWEHVRTQLAPYPNFGDLYATAEATWNTIDHPTVLAAFGMINGPDIEQDRMQRTLDTVMDTWPWNHTWGWDYPMIAMTAARLGDPETAIDALLLEVTKNTYLPNGHNFQQAERLRIYLPGNGGLLAAVAMMAAGWDGAPDHHAPGFPRNGEWTVKWEGLQPLP